MPRAIIPALLVTIGRFYIVESANWLSTRGKIEEAEEAVKKLLVRKPQYPAEIKLAARDGQATAAAPADTSYAALFNKTNRRATILASVPWFLQDLGTYGIGIFTPTILAAALGAQFGSCAQRRRPDRQRHHGRQGRRADHQPA